MEGQTGTNSWAGGEVSGVARGTPEAEIESLESREHHGEYTSRRVKQMGLAMDPRGHHRLVSVRQQSPEKSPGHPR